MDENRSKFTVIDRRRINTEGEARPEEQEDKRERESATPPPAPSTDAPRGPQLVSSAPSQGTKSNSEEELEPLPAAPQQEEMAQQKTAYETSSKNLENLLLQQDPTSQASQTIGFEHLVQQLYLSAMIQMGAGTPEGDRPRVDIVGARQTIDMLGVLNDKTAGNLSEREQQMLQTVLFELRMAFLELTNMITSSVLQPPPGAGQ